MSRTPRALRAVRAGSGVPPPEAEPATHAFDPPRAAQTVRQTPPAYFFQESRRLELEARAELAEFRVRADLLKVRLR